MDSAGGPTPIAAPDPTAAPEQRKKTCFVVMPFGAEREHPHTKEIINFDAIYEQLIKPAATAAGLECQRADYDAKDGIIHVAMLDRILSADMVIVDITTGNPNVFYELGVRHTARRSGTLIIRKAGDKLPFNIHSLRVVDYDFAADASALESYRQVLTANITANLDGNITDSLVHALIPGLNVSRRAVPIPKRTTFEWVSSRAPKRSFCVVTGDLIGVDNIDVWVNPENTKMQMGRLHDDSISASIRYYGAVKNSTGGVVRDLVRDDLRRQTSQGEIVEAGTVIATTPGELRRSNGVKVLLHVAAQHGEPGKGYITIRSYADCIVNTLEAVDELNMHWKTRLGLRAPLTSVIFPLFGTRGSRDGQSVTDRLVATSSEYLQRYPTSKLKRVCFLAYTDRDSELCEVAFRRAGFSYVKSDPP